MAGLFRFPASLITIALAVAVTLMMLVLLLSPTQRGYGYSNVFAYHGAFMCAAFCFFLPMGLTAYGFDFGPKGNSAYPDRPSRRLLHGACNMLAAFFACAGYLVAFVYHQNKGITHLALDMEEKSRPAHVFIGLFALAGIALQSMVGLWKMVTLTREGRKVLPQHGRGGPFIWLCGLLCICLAAWFEYRENFEGKQAWLLPQVFAIWIGIAALAVVVLLQLYKGSRAHVAADGKALGLGMGGYGGGYGELDEEEPYADVRTVRKQLMA